MGFFCCYSYERSESIRGDFSDELYSDADDSTYDPYLDSDADDSTYDPDLYSDADDSTYDSYKDR